MTGSSGSFTTLADANTIASLGSFSSLTGFTLADSTALSVTGPLTDGSGIVLVTGGALGIGGTITAPAISLTASGAVTEPAGAVIATTLTGSAASASLIQAANAIGTLSAFRTSGGFTLTDGSPLTISGSNAVGSGATLALNDDTPIFAAGSSLNAPGGAVVWPRPAATRSPWRVSARSLRRSWCSAAPLPARSPSAARSACPAARFLC